MFLQSCLPAQLRDSIPSLFFPLSFPGIHGKTGDWHSWFQWTRRMQSGGRSLLCASSGRTIWETPKSLTTTTSKIKVPPIIFIFRGLQKNISQVSQADRLAAIPPLQCRVCGGNTDFFYFFSLTCFVLFYFRLFKHWETSLHRNEPTRRVSPGTENYAASYWSDVSTILCSTYYTDTHTHWDTHMLRKNNPHTHTHTLNEMHTQAEMEARLIWSGRKWGCLLSAGGKSFERTELWTWTAAETHCTGSVNVTELCN